MKYYKMLKDNAFVGAVSSKNFIRYNPVVDCLILSNEQDGEFISYQGSLYRTSWMRPVQVSTLSYIEVLLIEITEEEYNTYVEAIAKNEEIIEEEEEEEEVIPEEEIPGTSEYMISLNFIRSSKLQEMSHICRTTIENGFDLELRGEMHHFSLDTQDQLNLISLSAMAQTQSMIPYHADGESCIFYTAEEINEIVETATAFKIYHTTYYNALKGYINSLETIEEVSAIEYGTPIPEEYKSDVLRVLEQ